MTTDLIDTGVVDVAGAGRFGLALLSGLRVVGPQGMEIEAAKLLGNPQAFMLVFLSHHCRCEFNLMHRFSFAEYGRQIGESLPGRVGRRVAIAAPRGAAKSTVHSLLFPIMDMLSGRERHQVIISGTMQQAKTRLASIARELRMNGAIRDAFFEGKVPRFKSNSRCIELGGCRIEAYSAGSEMRGIAHGEYRPTRIILDDVEQSSRAVVACHRRKLLKWYDEVVENLGDSYTHITVVGTILHTDSLLSTLLNRPGYKGELYKSIMAWDSRPDLWRVWRRLFTERGDGDGVERAGAFLAEHRQEMLEGTQVLWPGKEPYEKLQERMLIGGRSAFFKEKQNSPIRDGEQIFDTGLWGRFAVTDGRIELVRHAGEDADRITGNGREAVADVRFHPGQERKECLSHDSLKYFGFLDPAVGKSESRDGDFAAIVTIGRAPDNTLYVVHVWMDKVSPMKQVDQVFALHRQFRYEKFGFEANGFQDTLATLIKDKQGKLRKDGAYWHLPVEKFTHSHSKHSRISLLEPHILAGSILFQRDLPQAFLAQADEYTGKRSNHDDGLDALASCVEMIRSTERTFSHVKSFKGRSIRRF